MKRPGIAPQPTPIPPYLWYIDRRWKSGKSVSAEDAGSSLLQTLRQQRYDMVFNLADRWPSAVISKLDRAAMPDWFDFPKRRHPVWRYCHSALASTQHISCIRYSRISYFALPWYQLNEAPADGLQRSRLGRQPRPAAGGLPGTLHIASK